MSGAQSDEREFFSRMLAASAAEAAAAPALTVPAYLIKDLPWAADHPNKFVLILDNPQGQARSVLVDGNGWHWITEVDGSDLGPGNGSGS